MDLVRIPVLLIPLLLASAGCDRGRKPEVRETSGDGSAARAIGRGAYKASEEAGKVMKKAGKELGQGIKEASEGWKEARRESKTKKKKR